MTVTIETNQTWLAFGHNFGFCIMQIVWIKTKSEPIILFASQFYFEESWSDVRGGCWEIKL